MNNELNLYKRILNKLPDLNIKLAEPVKNHAYTKLGGMQMYSLLQINMMK